MFFFILCYYISYYYGKIRKNDQIGTTTMSNNKEYNELQNELYNGPMNNNNYTKGKTVQMELLDKVPICFEDEESSLVWQ